MQDQQLSFWRRPCGSVLFTAAVLATAMACGVRVSGQGPDGDSPQLSLIVRDSYSPGIPVLVRVEIRTSAGELDREVWDAEVSLATATTDATVTPQVVTLRSGIGSTLVQLSGPGNAIELTATVTSASAPVAIGLGASRTLASLAAADVLMVSGDLPSGDTEWSGVVHVTDDLLVPADGTLRVLPGALVLLEGVDSGESGADINVEGVLESLGTEEQPVTFTAADPSNPWGELDHHGDEPSRYTHTVITRTGHAPGVGHTGTGPAMRLRDGADIVLENCSFADLVGKVMYATDSDLELRGCLLERAVMGPEINGTALLLENSYMIGMFGELDNDGNDGDAIYIHGQQSDQDVTIRGAIVAAGTDDGIDTLGSEVLVEDTIVRDMSCDKGLSVFGGAVTVRRSLIVDNDKGLSAKSSDSSTVVLDHVTFSGNRWSIESRLKSNAQSPENSFQITNSIIRHNGAADGSEGCESNEPIGGRSIRTDFAASYFEIHYSDLEDGFQVEGELHTVWPGPGSNNISDDPMFMDPPVHDFHLQSRSPCIDTGDPAAPADGDGTRADMGIFYFEQTGTPDPRFSRGDANGDGFYDIGDPLRVLFHLFPPSLELSCQSAGDSNDDGMLDPSDAIHGLAYLFLGEAAPDAPFPACGSDPTGDNLTCESFPPCGAP